MHFLDIAHYKQNHCRPLQDACLPWACARARVNMTNLPRALRSLFGIRKAVDLPSVSVPSVSCLSVPSLLPATSGKSPDANILK